MKKIVLVFILLIACGCGTISVKRDNGFGHPYEGLTYSAQNWACASIFFGYAIPPSLILIIPIGVVAVASNTVADTIVLPVDLCVENEKERHSMADSLNELVPATRIKAATEVIVKSADKTVAEIMHSYSRNSDVVFLGLMEPKAGGESEYAERLIKLASGFNTTIFVHNAGEFAGHLI